MKILLDMNIPMKYGCLLKEKDFDITRWSDVGAPNADDMEIMRYASEKGFVLLTSDLDFSAILSAIGASKPSVVQLRASIAKADYAANLIAATLKQYKNALEQGAILSIELNRARLRILPL